MLVRAVEDHSLGNGAPGENRTPTLSPEADFESAASTNSATEAQDKRAEYTEALPRRSMVFMAGRAVFRYH